MFFFVYKMRFIEKKKQQQIPSSEELTESHTSFLFKTSELITSGTFNLTFGSFDFLWL